MSLDKDVTHLVRYGSVDDECLPIDKCVCGATFGHWKFFISIYRDHSYRCPSCGRGLYFSCRIRVFEVVDAEVENAEND